MSVSVSASASASVCASERVRACVSCVFMFEYAHAHGREGGAFYVRLYNIANLFATRQDSGNSFLNDVHLNTKH